MGLSPLSSCFRSDLTICCNNYELALTVLNSQCGICCVQRSSYVLVKVFDFYIQFNLLQETSSVYGDRAFVYGIWQAKTIIIIYNNRSTGFNCRAILYRR